MPPLLTLSATMLATALLTTLRRSAATTVVLFLYGNALPLSFLFRRLLRPGFGVRGQIDLPQDLRSFQLFRPDILDDRRTILLCRRAVRRLRPGLGPLVRYTGRTGLFLGLIYRRF